MTISKRNITTGYWVNFFMYLYFFLPIWYVYETKFVSPTMLGIIYAVSHLTTVFLELPTGALADLIGRRKTILLGLAITALSYLILAAAVSAAWIWAGYIVIAVGMAFISGSDSALLYDSLKIDGIESKFSTINSRQGFVLRSAIVIGTLLGGYLYVWHMRLPYLLTGIFTVIACIISFNFKEPTLDSQVFGFRNYLIQVRQGFLELFKSQKMRWFSFYYLIVGGLGWYFLFFLNQPFAIEKGFDDIERGYLFSLLYLVVSLILVFGVSWLKKNELFTIVLLPVALVLGYLPSLWVNKLLSVGLIALVQLVGIIRFSVLDHLANEVIVSKYRATAMSALNMLVSLFVALLSVLGGFVTEKYSASIMMFSLGIIAFVAGLPVAGKMYFLSKTGK